MAARNLGLTLKKPQGPNETGQIITNIERFVTQLANKFNPDRTGRARSLLYPSFYNMFHTWGNKRAYGGPQGTQNRFIDTALLNYLRDKGIVPMLSWGPIGGAADRISFFANDPADTSHFTVPNQYIAQGGMNTFLNQIAKEFCDWQNTLVQGTKSAKGIDKIDSVFIRYCWEVNIDNYGWYDGYPNGTSNGWAGAVNNATNFKSAFNHVASYLKARTQPGVDHAGTGEMLFIYCASGPAAVDETYVNQHYPGATNVDYLGIDKYFPLSCTGGDSRTCRGRYVSVGNADHSYAGTHTIGGYQTLAGQIKACFDRMQALGSGTHPFIIPEIGIRNTYKRCPRHDSVECEGHPNNAPQRGAWLRDGLRDVWDISSRIRSVGYYNVDMRELPVDNPEGDNWSLGTGDALTAYAIKAAAYNEMFAID